MNEITPDRQKILAIWQRLTHAEFVLKDPDAALATMSEDPYVLCIPSGTGGAGRTGVREFYASQFLPSIPPDFELFSVSQTFGDERSASAAGLDAPQTCFWGEPDFPLHRI